ncbi:MAG: hypothetical protein ABEJ89_05005 [Haloarculaceae archaeon]
MSEVPFTSGRRFLALTTAGVAAVAGCTSGEEGGDSTIRDSDGDGVIDSEDYAPRDPEVQERSDVTGGNGETDGGTATGGEGGGTETATPTAIERRDLTYPSHSGTHTITARSNYWAWEFGVDAPFVLEYRVVNLRDENYDFDVLLYPPDRFAEYRAIATEQREGIRPQYVEGSAPGVRSGAEATVRFEAGTYYLVVDNTDLSDAGDWGTEDTRRVRVEARTRAP